MKIRYVAMIKKILTAGVFVIGAYLCVDYAMDLYRYYHMMLMPAPKAIGLEAGPVKAVIDPDTPWEGIAKLIVTVVGTYLGIRLVNKYIK